MPADGRLLSSKDPADVSLPRADEAISAFDELPPSHTKTGSFAEAMREAREIIETSKGNKKIVLTFRR